MDPTACARNFSHLRVALVHFWHIRRGGAERVLEVLADMFPQADLYFLVANPRTFAPALRRHTIHTSYLQHWPGSRRYHRHFLPFYPLALESFDLSGYDLVISHESGPAKGVITGPDTCHVCYCYSPMRYVWHMTHEYRRSMSGGWAGRMLFSVGAHYVRQWDLAAASRVDCFLASCGNSARRIRKFYRRDCEVVYPPVSLSDEVELVPPRPLADYYLVVSRLVVYKRIDLAIAACRTLGRRLVIIGGGEERRRLEQLAGGDARIEFLGEASDETVRAYYRGCRALLLPGEEDFGLTPVEAQAYGRPVIAFGRGGALETVRPWEAGMPTGSATGVLFGEPEVASLVGALRSFEDHEDEFDPVTMRTYVQRFDVSHFRADFYAQVTAALQKTARGREAAATAVV